MANYDAGILVAVNRGKELDGDMYVFSKAKGKHPLFLCTEAELAS